MMTASEILSIFPMVLSRKASACGVDVSNVKIDWITTEATWGDRCGFVFYGAERATLERVAAYFERWISKHGGRGSYACQRSIKAEGVFTFTRFSNGAEGWHRGEEPKPEPKIIGKGEPHEFTLTCEEHDHGVAVSTHYYPGAD